MKKGAPSRSAPEAPQNRRDLVLEHLLFGLNSVLPLFVLVAIIDDKFINTGTKVGFQAALPVLLFQQVAEADITSAFSPRLILWALGMSLAVVAVLCVTVPLLVKENGRRGAIIQGIFRGNYAILGVPLAISMFGEAGAVHTTMLLPFTVSLYNLLAVTILVFFGPKDGEQNRIEWKNILLGIATNPLIIGILLGLPFSLLHITLPEVVDRSLSNISALTTPLTLICLGGQFRFDSALKNLRCSLTAALCKQVLIPTVMLTLAVLLGFRDGELGAIFIMFMAPTAVSSYIMAKNMGGDHVLTSSVVVTTTLLSAFTLTAWIWVLRTVGFL